MLHLSWRTIRISVRPKYRKKHGKKVQISADHDVVGVSKGGAQGTMFDEESSNYTANYFGKGTAEIYCR
jgi:hypothetical protein